MLIVVIVVAIVAVGLLVLYLTTRSAAEEYRTGAEKREADLTAERDQLSTARAGLEAELATARKEHAGYVEQKTAELKKAGEEKARLTSELGTAEAELETVKEESAEQSTKITEQIEEISNLVSETSSLRTKLTEAEAALVAAEARNTGVLIGDVVDIGGSQPETLWDLEVKRSERTWRTSVASNPDAPVTPFEDTDDPVRVAVEIEAAALRENVGAFITIEWRAEPIEAPARRHLVVRVAQELLEAAARSPEASRLVVSDDGDEVNLRLEPAGDDEVVNIIPPRITSDLVEVREETTIAVKTPAVVDEPATDTTPQDGDGETAPAADDVIDLTAPTAAAGIDDAEPADAEVEPAGEPAPSAVAPAST